MRSDPRCPQILQDIELTARTAVFEHIGEPAQLVLLRHAAGTERSLVERCEADRVDVADSRLLQRHTQTGEHERTVARPGFGAWKWRRIPALPIDADKRVTRSIEVNSYAGSLCAFFDA